MKLKSKLLLALLATSSAAFAQTAPAAPEVTYNVGVVSQYRYRGLAQSKGLPALQGGVDYTNANGAYLGAWASTIKWIKDTSVAGTSSYSGNTELDLYGGYKFQAAGIDLDLGALRYQYIGNTLGNDGTWKNANTNELYVAATSGQYTFKWSYAMSPLFGTPATKGSDYFDLTANFDMGNGITLTPHVGRALIQGYVTGSTATSYNDLSATLSKDLGSGLTASGGYIITSAKSAGFNSGSGYATGKNAFVFGLKQSF